MINLRRNTVSRIALLLCVTVGLTANVLAQRNHNRDPLAALSHAINEANAPALTADQQTQLKTLITTSKAALPTTPDAALEAAEAAFDAVVLAGNQTAANAQATIIANREAALSTARLQAEAQFLIASLAILRSGGQLDPLTAKFGSDRVLELLESLASGGYEHGPS